MTAVTGRLARLALAGAPAAIVLLVAAAGAAARTDLTSSYELKRCPGTIHAGFTPQERRPALRYGRYRKLSCGRARAIVRLVDRVDGPYPSGYGWRTPHGPSSSWPAVSGTVLRATYLAPDGLDGSQGTPGIAVVTFR